MSNQHTDDPDPAENPTGQHDTDPAPVDWRTASDEDFSAELAKYGIHRRA